MSSLQWALSASLHLQASQAAYQRRACPCPSAWARGFNAHVDTDGNKPTTSVVRLFSLGSQPFCAHHPSESRECARWPRQDSETQSVTSFIYPVGPNGLARTEGLGPGSLWGRTAAQDLGSIRHHPRSQAPGSPLCTASDPSSSPKSGLTKLPS